MLMSRLEYVTPVQLPAMVNMSLWSFSITVILHATAGLRVYPQQPLVPYDSILPQA